MLQLSLKSHKKYFLSPWLGEGSDVRIIEEEDRIKSTFT